jgi:parallel beta-helix repeat protein
MKESVMRGIVRNLGAGVALVVIVAALPAFAAEGRIPIWQPVQIFPGTEGQYVVTRNIGALPGMPVIDILPGTVSVDIDLNGFTLYGLDTDIIHATQIDSLTIRNGTLLFGMGDGIRVDEARKVVIEDVKIQFVEQRGIELNEVYSFALRRNVLANMEQGEGIYVDGSFVDPSLPTSGTIEDNLVRQCFRGINLFFGSSVMMQNNRIEACPGDGIFVSPGPTGALYGCIACIIAENTIQESGAIGMWLSHFEASKVYNNTVTFSGAEGIWLDVLSDDNLVLDNVSSQNGANGLLVDSNQNHLERNVLNTNGLFAPPAWGMHLRGFANTYRGNTALGNAGNPALCPGFPATTDFCDATGGANTSPLNQPPTLAGDNLMPGLL